MIVTIHSVFCDRRECGAWIAQEKTRLHARRVARDYGWTRVLQGDSMIDLCPECSDGTPVEDDFAARAAFTDRALTDAREPGASRPLRPQNTATSAERERHV